MLATEHRVDGKVKLLHDVTYDDLYFYEERLKRYIDKMKPGCASGIDGIMSEHLKYATNCTSLIHQNVCIVYNLFKIWHCPILIYNGIDCSYT